MSIPYAVTDVDINRVSKSFVQSSLGSFAISTMPKALCLDRFTGRSNKTDYDLASLSNALQSSTNLRDWSPGIDPPVPTTLGESAVSFEVRIRSTYSLVRPLKRGQTMEHRFADLENNIVPIQLSKVYQAHDADIAAAMVNTGLFTRQNFTVSSGKGLDSTDDYANQNPVKDIENNLVLLRPYSNFAGLELRCYMSGKVASVLATHPSYTGGGSGSAVASGLPRADFINRFSSLHGCKTYVFDNLTNSAALGASLRRSIRPTARPCCSSASSTPAARPLTCAPRTPTTLPTGASCGLAPRIPTSRSTSTSVSRCKSSGAALATPSTAPEARPLASPPIWASSCVQ
jgi:hypothetical protein